jgi:hypothetical protein
MNHTKEKPMLRKEHELMLKFSAQPKREDMHLSRQALDDLIHRIHMAEPEKFHTPQTLHLRKFYHEPQVPIPYSDFLIPWANSIINKRKKI